jgi:hypothetical protein
MLPTPPLGQRQPRPPVPPRVRWLVGAACHPASAPALRAGCLRRRPFGPGNFKSLGQALVVKLATEGRKISARQSVSMLQRQTLSMRRPRPYKQQRYDEARAWTTPNDYHDLGSAGGQGPPCRARVEIGWDEVSGRVTGPGWSCSVSCKVDIGVFTINVLQFER